jgi:hypothetical protein
MRSLLSWRNWMDEPGAIIRVDAETPGLGAVNLATPQIAGDVWRAAYAGATRTITVDLGAVREIGAIGLAFPRDGLAPLAHDAVRLSLSSIGAGGTEALDTSNISLECDPWGFWCYPIAAGIRRNGVHNPSLRDGSQGWVAAGSPGPLQWGQATTVNALADIGSGMAARLNGTLGVGQSMELRYTGLPDPAGIPVVPTQVLEMQAQVSAQGCWVRPIITFWNAGGANMGGAVGAPVLPRTGQYRFQASEFQRVTLAGTAPAGAVKAFVGLLGESPSGTVTDPAIWCNQVSAYEQDEAGQVPIFAGHYVGLAGGARTEEAQIWARYVTLRITSARPYLDIGRLWIGPAIVPQYGREQEQRAVEDAGQSQRAPLTGQAFDQPGLVRRRTELAFSLLSEAEARRLDIAARTAGRRQVLGVRDVLRANATGMIGELVGMPAPLRASHRFWAANWAIEEST